MDLLEKSRTLAASAIKNAVAAPTSSVVGVSWLSRFLAFVGAALVGTPAALGVREDFYYLPSERWMPTPAELDKAEVQQEQVAAEHFRRAVVQRIGLIASGLAFVACLVVSAFASTVSLIAR